MVTSTSGSVTCLRSRTKTGPSAVAFYAIVHVPTAELHQPLEEMARVLAPGGLALLAFHVGIESPHVDELFGVATSLDFHLHPVDAVELRAEAAGLERVSVLVREPYAGAEHPTRRAYLLFERRLAPGMLTRTPRRSAVSRAPCPLVGSEGSCWWAWSSTGRP